MKTNNQRTWLVTTLLVLSVALLAMAFVACGGDNTPADTTADTSEATQADGTGAADATVADTNADAETPTETETNATEGDATVAETVAATEPVTEAQTEAPSIKEQLGLEIKMSDLSAAMQPIFKGNTSTNETVMFLDKGDVKSLLYPITSITSVTSYDGSKTYTEGTDYEVVDGKLKVLANSSIPCITSAKYYGFPGVGGLTINTKNPATGQMVSTFWGESQMKQYQVCVTYTHDATWEGYTQECQLDVYQNLVKKLQNGENVTVFFYGDSITWGACSSFLEGAAPKQGSYAMLLVEALADLFDYTVKYINTGLADTMACAPVPTKDYVAGTRGTITYVNTAIGGWTSTDGVNKFDKMFKATATQYGCDLAIIAFGMNDGGSQASVTSNNVKNIANKIYAINENASIVLLSTMVPHNGSNWDFAPIKQQEAKLQQVARNFRGDDKVCAVACMTSVSQAILKHKTFNDYSGNNINHPNDWFYRVYAQTILQTIIGYENMN